MTGKKRARRHALITAVLTSGFPALAHAESESFLEKTLDTPDWLTIRGSHRTRFEALHSPDALMLFTQGIFQSQFYQTRDAYAGGYFETTGLVSLQSTLFIEADFGRIRIGGELLDARSYYPVTASYSCNVSCLSPFATTNAVEPLQAYVTVDLGNESELTAGRFTMDLGSGRLIARSDFRNTLQSFHGVKAQLPVARHGQLSFFYTLPYSRQIEDHNEISYDKPVAKFHFLGAHYESESAIEGAIAEAYLFGTVGRISASSASFPEQAQLTPGARVYRSPKAGVFDFEVEAAAQLTINGPSSGQYFGYFAHIEGGKTFNNRWNLRTALLFDVATGSDNELRQDIVTAQACTEIPFCNNIYGPEGPIPYSGDHVLLSISRNNPAEFNSLFGALDGDFGPEGLFGALPRRDIISPAIRLEAEPTSRSNFQITYRPARRFTSDKNYIARRFTEQGIFDGSISYKAGWAHQLDGRFDYRLFGDNVMFSLGAAIFDSRLTTEYNNVSGIGAYEVLRENASPSYYGYSSIQARF